MRSHADPRGFTSAPDTRAKGRVAESAAVRWLRRQGYEILVTNFAVRVGEIDVIAIEDAIDKGDGPTDVPTLCFIEVKARRNADYGSSLSAVTHHKQQRIAKVASAYLTRSEWSGPCRFDVLGMDRDQEGWAFTLIRGAFDIE